MSMRVWIDNDRLTSFGLTVADIAAALRARERRHPVGPHRRARSRVHRAHARRARHRARLRGDGRRDVKGQAVRLRDVGRVEIGPETERKVVRFNGEAAVGLGVVKLSGANTIAVVDAVTAEIEKIRAELPPDVKLTDRLRRLDLHPRLDLERAALARRGDRAGADRDLPVPAHAARDAGARRRDPGLDHRHLLDPLLRRLHDQHADADGPHARDRPRRRRRDHRAREHHALDRGRDAAARGRDPRHARDLVRGGRVDGLGGRGVPAARVSVATRPGVSSASSA